MGRDQGPALRDRDRLRAAVPPIPGLERVPYLTNETVFELTERRDHLIVIGAGPIGLELAQAFRRLGSAVTVLEAFRSPAEGRSRTGAIVLEERLVGDGIAIGSR